LINIKAIENQAYTPHKDQINLVYKNGEVKDISMASDQLHMELLPNDAMKYFFILSKRNRIIYKISCSNYFHKCEK